MTLHFAVSAALLLGAATFFIIALPRRWQRQISAETDADWLRLRQRELADAAPELREEAALRIIEDGPVPDAPEDGRAARYSTGRQVAAASLMLVLVVGLYLWLGNLEDVEIAAALEDLEQASPKDIPVLIQRIRRRAERRPDNADYSLLLGEYYLSTNEPLNALIYFERLIAEGATSPDILGKAAQAEFLSADRRLSERARSRAEQALAIDPTAATALATLGMAAFEAADFATAIRYWEALRSLEAEGSPGHQMLGQVIERARSEMDESTTSAPAIAGAIRVRVALPDAFQAPEAATVYVFARPEQQQSGMPIAVVRQEVTQWPLTITLDDQNSMAGQKLSGFKAVSIEVQISGNGQPGRDNSLAWGVINSAPVGSLDPVVVVPETVDLR
jgi:cytochrome c-type biogenesis protein CcmH